MILTTPSLASKPLRIISLVPSQTELLHYLGLEEETIAITKFCTHPTHWFQNKTSVGGTKSINIEKIISLKPDLIIANKEENVKEQVEALGTHLPVWVTEVNNLNDSYKMIRDIGSLTVTSEAAEQLIIKIEDKFYKLRTVTEIKVAYLIWKDPYMTVGGDTFINDMLKKAGMKNVFDTKRRYPEINISQLKESGCKWVLLSSEPYPFKHKHIAELSLLLPEINIRLVDGEMFSWYGSRLLEAAGYLQTLSAEMVSD